jgi:hypothetical protein
MYAAGAFLQCRHIISPLQTGREAKLWSGLFWGAWPRDVILLLPSYLIERLQFAVTTELQDAIINIIAVKAINLT